MVDRAKIVLETDTSQVKQADDSLDKLNKTGKQTDSVFKGVASQTKKTDSAIGRFGQTVSNTAKKVAGSFKAQSNAVQVGAFQVQDFAVQVQSGQSAMTAFAQQAPQFFGVFGAGGAILGTVTAITTAIAGPFIMSLLKAEDAADKLDDALEDLDDTINVSSFGVVSLSKAYDDLIAKSGTFSEIIKAEAQAKFNVLLKESAANIKELGDQFEVSFRGQGNRIRESATAIQELNKEFGLTEEETRKLNSALSDFSKTPSIATAEELQFVIAEIQKQNTSLTDSFVIQSAEIATATEQYKQLTIAAQESQSVRKQEQILAQESFGLDPFKMNAFDDSQLLQDDPFNDAEKAMTDFVNMQEKLAAREDQIQQMRVRSQLSFWSRTLSIMSSGLEEGSGLQKAAFAAQKAVDVASIISSTHVAAANAAAIQPWYLGQTLSALTKVAGYASAGIVAGQTISSFDGGGFTGSGSRSGGVDGKGGFPAILHPNETVIDHTKGQSMAPKVEVYNYSGEPAQVKTANDVVQVMIGQAANTQSGFMRAMRQNTNVQTRGVR